MIPIDIVPCKEIPFVNPDDEFSYYCNKCETYTSDFYNSAVRTGYRRCRACHKSRITPRSPLYQMMKKLKDNLSYRGQRGLAKAVKEEHVRAILQERGIETEDQLELVKTITPIFDAVREKWTYNVVFK